MPVALRLALTGPATVLVLALPVALPLAVPVARAVWHCQCQSGTGAVSAVPVLVPLAVPLQQVVDASRDGVASGRPRRTKNYR